MEGGSRKRKRKTSSSNRCYRYRKCAPFSRTWYESWNNYELREGPFLCHGHLKKFKIFIPSKDFLKRIHFVGYIQKKSKSDRYSPGLFFQS